MSTNARKYHSPRIEIALVSKDSGDLFDVYMFLHLPDGKEPTAIQLDGGPFDKLGAIDFILEAYTAIGKKYATPTAKFGMEQPKSPLS